ncbi:MAG: hypothetical protein H6838_19330 [Planctomycetes bacterium]|nr:hypothetical protein [Planctomycetota bacterium]MCB9887651.1 hypothetical protein [Planctomycetota bacterium]
MHQDSEIRALLRDLLEALEATEDSFGADIVSRVLEGTGEELDALLASNELWGGAGSIADQAGVDGGREARRPIEGALVRLGEAQLRAGLVNQRTRMWVDTFKMWHDRGI